MHSNFNELIERGFIDESGRALKEITFYDLIGRESGVYRCWSSDYPNDETIGIDMWAIGNPDGWRAIDHYDLQDGARVLAYRVYDWGGITFDCFFKFDELPTIDANRPYGWGDEVWLTNLGELAQNPEGKAIEIELDKNGVNHKITIFSPHGWN